MITASTFVHKHNSFWHTYFPALDNYVRLVNSGAYTRLYTQYDGHVSPERSYIVSETAFCLAYQNDFSEKGIIESFNTAKKRLSGLSGVPRAIEELSMQEINTAQKWAHQLQTMSSLKRERPKKLYNPEFPGCGLLCKSTADILIDDNTLIEVKCVDRSFRSTDFRQLITYTFQAMESGVFINSLVVLNPRKGIFFEENLSQFVLDTSASDILELQGRFRASIGMSGISR